MTNDESTPNDDARERVVQAHKMGGDVTVDCTSNEELRNLVEEWYGKRETTVGNCVGMKNKMLSHCASELEEVIENNEL